MRSPLLSSGSAGLRQDAEKVRQLVLASLRGSTYRSVRLASSLAAALLDGLLSILRWFPRSLLAAGDPFLTVRLVQMIEDIVGFRQHDISILEDWNIILA